MNSFSRNQIINLNQDKEIIDAFHPLYCVDSRSYTKDTAKEALKISSKNVILFFGLIRDYKGLDLLINSVKYLNNRIADLKVLVVGENYESMSKYYDLIDKANLKDQFLFDLQFVEEHNIAKYFISSDIVVLPYKTASQSGIISLAYNFNRPVIVTDVGGLREYVVENKTGFIVNPDEKDLSNKINYFFENKLFEEMSLFIKNYKDKFSWKNFEERINEK
jgi:glycosyltransferase involved in cell wall biosynthesis